MSIYSAKSTIDADGRLAYRITKFTDGNVESSYLTNGHTCDCPAGPRPTCRHRQMLPQMIRDDIINTEFFLNWDDKRGVVDFDGNTVPASMRQLAPNEGVAERNPTATEIAQMPLPELKESLLEHIVDRAASTLAPTAEAMATRRTFTIPDGFEAIRDAEGRATGEIEPAREAPNVPANSWRRL